MERDATRTSANDKAVFWGGSALALWALTGLCFFAVIQLRLGVAGPGQGVRMPPLFGLALLFGFGAVTATWTAGIWAILAAVWMRDWIRVVSLGVVAVLATLAGYALLLTGHLDSHVVVSAIYGFSPDRFGFHPVVVPASIGLIVTMPAVAFAQGLASRGWVRRACCIAGLILALALLGAIRVAN